MAILGLDSSSYLVSLGLVQGHKVLGDVSHLGERRHLGKLISWLDYLLQEAGVSRQDLQGIACVTGPGSFTGLRIGLASMQGLALALGIPMVGLCSLDVVAASVESPRSCVLVNSRGDTFFYATYLQGRLDGEIRVASLAEILPGLPETTTVVTPDFEKVVEAAVRYPQLNFRIAIVSGARVAQLGQILLAKGEGRTADRIMANYLRDSFTEEIKHVAKV